MPPDLGSRIQKLEEDMAHVRTSLNHVTSEFDRTRDDVAALQNEQSKYTTQVAVLTAQMETLTGLLKEAVRFAKIAGLLLLVAAIGGPPLVERVIALLGGG